MLLVTSQQLMLLRVARRRKLWWHPCDRLQQLQESDIQDLPQNHHKLRKSQVSLLISSQKPFCENP